MRKARHCDNDDLFWTIHRLAVYTHCPADPGQPNEGASPMQSQTHPHTQLGGSVAQARDADDDPRKRLIDQLCVQRCLKLRQEKHSNVRGTRVHTLVATATESRNNHRRHEINGESYKMRLSVRYHAMRV